MPVPASASQPASVNCCCTRRERLAPRAARKAASRPCPTPRDNSRPATFAQAIASTGAATATPRMAKNTVELIERAYIRP